MHRSLAPETTSFTGFLAIEPKVCSSVLAHAGGGEVHRIRFGQTPSSGEGHLAVARLIDDGEAIAWRVPDHEKVVEIHARWSPLDARGEEHQATAGDLLTQRLRPRVAGSEALAQADAFATEPTCAVVGRQLRPTLASVG